ncbi:4-methyl-5(b-hydroxyethyl)-thiazole monophosphate biosynthesis [Thiohalospira halophila DSM 15071]|uniref:4-methyl-5(B-hydroxyethyl)-thiazole monophosphate biosynthesis n=1 Tax=Thiohalospira halophila DSM 15071 TaxID=1123397 RepID=A0A1I1RMH8_9GAMM|nr:DJ-1 family glyoxalase III [Thiohalospira halophila]SFD31620.1 4-methyl-5(b-hydroxyethyl)-thiazole monophosphate biosynthesis [Thiohalospira halophila DSM 15071]
MSSVLVPLAEGFEELEAITIVDILRRGQVEVTTAGVEPGPVTASRGSIIIPDAELDEVLESTFDLIALPGGLPGADHLRDDDRVQRLLRDQAAAGRPVAAICAGPKALAAAGLLAGRRVTSFPGALDGVDQPGLEYVEYPVVADGPVTGVDGTGPVITSRGPGTAMDFALTLLELLEGRDVRERVEAALQRP